MKKIVSFILTLAMVMSLSSVPVLADTITSTDEGNNAVSKSVTVTYIPEDEKAVITSISVEVDGQIYNSGDIVTLTPNSGNVTITVKGNNFTNLNANNNKLLYADSSFDDVSSADGWTVNDENTEASKTFELSKFQNCTTVFEIKYSNEGDDPDKYIGSGIRIVYQNETVSVGITWGAMNFTYSDEQVDGSDKGWTCETGANTVKVENNGTEDIAVGISYKQANDYKAISGKFNKYSETLAKDGNATFTLTLSGKPDAALSGTNIGTVTVTIMKEIDVASASELEAALTSNGSIKFTDSVSIASEFTISASTSLILNLNGKTLSAENSDCLIIESGSNVTINDDDVGGGVKGKDYGVYCEDSSTLVINGGSYEGANEYDLAVYGGSDVTINGGTFGGVFVGDGTMTINGGRIEKFNCNTATTVYITDGIVNAKNASNPVVSFKGTIIITGGTFNFDPSATGRDKIKLDTTTHTVTDNGDGTWTVTAKKKN